MKKIINTQNFLREAKRIENRRLDPEMDTPGITTFLAYADLKELLSKHTKQLPKLEIKESKGANKDSKVFIWGYEEGFNAAIEEMESK